MKEIEKDSNKQSQLASKHQELFSIGSKQVPTKTKDTLIKQIFGSLDVPPEPQLLAAKVRPQDFIEFRKVAGEIQKRKNIMQTSNQLTQSLVGASFTSTTAAVATENSIKELSDLERRMEYMQLIKSRQDASQAIIVTDQGRMTFEIYCGKSPNMAEKFIELALTKFFNDLQFEN